MDIMWARKMYKTASIYDIPMRVVHYDRVSSDKDEQLNSLANQNLYNEETIRKNPNWTYAGRYVDEGITGISVSKREDFQRLIDDAKNGKFDFVITKEISRFARNILDSIYYTRELLSYGVCVFFQNDNINTIEEDSEFRLSIMASVAQEESRKLSSRVKYGHNVSMKNGVILGREIYGYTKKDKKTLEYDEHYKPMIEFIFEKYASEEMSTNKLSDAIYAMGYKSFSGGKIDAGTIKHIIVNPKYKGYYCGRKVQIIDMFNKKQKFFDKDEWILYKDFEHIPPIVSEELWEKANRVYAKRSREVKNRNTSYGNLDNKFTKKIVCGNDGEYYWLKSHKSRNQKIKGDNPTWICSKKKKKADSCNSIILYESELIPIIIDIIKSTNLTSDIVSSYIEMYKSVSSSEDFTQQIITIQSEIDRINLKKEKILDYNLDGKISDEEFTKRNNEFNRQIEEKTNSIKEYRRKASKADDITIILKEINKEFQAMKNIDFTEINRIMIDRLFEKIIATPIDENHMDLVFVLRNGDRYSSKYPPNSKANNVEHLGYMVNTILPERSKHFKRFKNKWCNEDFLYTYSLGLIL